MEKSLLEEYEEMIEDMSVADMPNQDMIWVAQTCGLEVAILLLRKFSGTQINIPKRNPFGKVAERFIIHFYDGTNAKKLAKTCNLSRRNVDMIVKKEDLIRKTNRENIKNN